MNQLFKTKTKPERKKIIEIINKYLPIETKQKKAIPELLKYLKDNNNFDHKSFKKKLESDIYKIYLAGKGRTSQEIKKWTLGVNPSLYLSNSEAFYTGLKLLDNNNAQKEYYFTDIVGHLLMQRDNKDQSRYRMTAVNAEDPSVIQGFNAPDELLAIQDFVRRKKENKLKKSAKKDNGLALSKKQYRRVSLL